MNQKKSLGFGLRGWLLIIVLFTGFMTFQVFTNFPLNILADFYGGAQTVAMILTIGTLLGVILQIVLSAFMSKIKSIKILTAIFGIIAMVAAIGTAAVPFTNLKLWYVCYFAVNLSVTIYALFGLSILAGQWFPRRKGTIMGISTIAYPVTNGVIGFFAGAVFGQVEQGVFPAQAIMKGFIPFLAIAIIGFLIFIIGITDYPEQVGAYRDNDKSFTPEAAKKMMEQEVKNRMTTVWTTPHIFANRDFWFAAVTCGLLLCGAVGTMTQSNAIIGAFPQLDYTKIMMVVAIFGAIGSWLLGVIDTAIGTKKSMIIATFLMVLSGILGIIAAKTGASVPVVIALIFVAMFMGASSNYTVSAAAQYWRGEDFPGVFACVNPTANIFNAFAPTIVAALIASSLQITGVFIFLLIAGIVGVILMVAFSAAHVKEIDDKYRKAAGKPLDNALAGRK